MSLKTTPRGLLAATAVTGLILLQLPAIAGHVSAASVGTRAATHSAATSRPHDITPGPVGNGTFTINPAAGPVGTAIGVAPSSPVSPSTPVTVTFTDANGAVTTATNTITGTTLTTVTVPLNAATGAASVRATFGSGATTLILFIVNAETASVSPSSGATRGTVETLSLNNYAPGVLITSTLVYSNASTSGISQTVVATSTPNISGTASATFSLPSNIAYGSTAVVSLTSTYPVTPSNNSGSFPSIAVGPAPAIVVSPATVGAAGISQTLTVSVTTGAFIITSTAAPANPSIALQIGLPGVTPTTLTPITGTFSTSGVFTATVQYTPSVAGTYLITATDVGPNNVASSTFQVAVPAAPVATSYFAEGYTGGSGTLGYHTILNLLNPNSVSVIVTDTYLLETSASNVVTTSTPDVVVVTHTLAGMSDATVDVAADIASQPVSSGPDAGKTVSGSGQRVATIVRTAGFTTNSAVRGVAAERIIERLSGSAAAPKFSDGDVSLGTTAANTSYYFAEGYTGSSFQEYLVLFNPSPTVTATASVIRAPEGTATTLAPLGPYVLAPYQRVTLNISALNVGAPKSTGLIVNSDKPIVAERPEYFGPGNGSSKPGMTVAAGLTTASKQLSFAYTSLTGGFDVANPVTGTIVPTSDVQQTIDDRPFVTVINPNIAGQVVAGTTSGTATAPGPSAHVTIQLRGEDGRLAGFFISDVDAGSRFTLSYNDLTSGSGGISFPGVPRSAPTRAGLLSVTVSSSERVAAELTNYFGQGPITASGDAGAGAPGLTLVGAPSGETDVLFPSLRSTEIVAGAAVSNTVVLYNPGVNAIQVSGAFMDASGVVTRTTYTVGPDAIQVVGQHLTDSGGTGSAAGTPIPSNAVGAEFSLVPQRGSNGTGGGPSGEPGQGADGFVAAVVSHSGDASNWWGTQGYYPLPTACSTASGCS